MSVKTRAIRRSDYNPAAALSEENTPSVEIFLSHLL